VGLGHRAHDPARAGTAGTDKDLDREHAAREGRAEQRTPPPVALRIRRLSGILGGTRGFEPVPEDWRPEAVKDVTLGPASTKGTSNGQQPEGQLRLGVPAQADRRGPRSERTSEAVRDFRPSRPNRSTTGQVSMKGNGSGRRLWNCLVGRHHGDMEIYGRGMIRADRSTTCAHRMEFAQKIPL
jgi:hypothetical protein